jgi:hypothetical protein
MYELVRSVTRNANETPTRGRGKRGRGARETAYVHGAK